LTPQAACDNEKEKLSEEEIRRFLASIGSKGGKAGTGAKKRRGGTDYYKRISQLAAKARKEKKRQKATERKIE
jgi:hypothetical protein